MFARTNAGGLMTRSRALGPIISFALIAGCGASTVAASDGDAAPIALDASPSEVATVDVVVVDAAIVDEAAPDAGAVDAERDSAVDVRVCPMPVDEDVPAADVPATDGPYVVELAVGSQLNRCARMSDGTLRCRGWNHDGQLGVGTWDLGGSGPGRTTAVVVPGLNDVEQVVTTNVGAVCTRHRDGTVRCWGSNQYNMLGTGHAGDVTCASGRPCRPSPTLVPGLTDVVFLAVSGFAICAVGGDGAVRCWGSVDPLLPRGGSATPVLATAVSDVARLYSLNYGWVVQLRSGTYATYQIADPAAAALDIPSAAQVVYSNHTFSSHLCYRLPDGTARCLGENWFGKVGNGRSDPQSMFVSVPADPGLCGVRSVVAGTYNSCALMADRTVQCWGEGEYGALGFDPPDLCGGLDGDEAAPCATRPGAVRGLDGVDQLFVGVWGGCALRVDRSVWCWGSLSPDLASGTLGPVEW
jgi:hypothetical protein